MEIMRAEDVRKISDENRELNNNIECQIKLKVIMDRVHRIAKQGEYVLRDPFKDVNYDVRPLLTKHLRELGYEVEFDVGDDGPGRPGMDELRWKR
jgi:hypothetical protein